MNAERAGDAVVGVPEEGGKRSWWIERLKIGIRDNLFILFGFGDVRDMILRIPRIP